MKHIIVYARMDLWAQRSVYFGINEIYDSTWKEFFTIQQYVQWILTKHLPSPRLDKKSM